MGQIVYFTRRLVSTLLCFPIRVYRMCISPFLGSHCRFYPSCSEYALLAIQHHGPFKGLWVGLCRILRCHPWSLGGYDPILPNHEENV